MDNLDRKNPDRHTCNACDRKFIAQNPNTIDGVPVCTLCLIDDTDKEQ